MKFHSFPIRFPLARFCARGCLLLALAVGGFSPAWAEDEPIVFNRDVRPLLSDNCYACHGPDEKQREAGLRLDTRAGALAELESGGFALVPGDRAKSKLHERITAADADERMPPLESGKSLSPAEIELLATWIDQGAPWQVHWSLLKPERPAPPAVQHEQRVRNEIDRFIFAELESRGLKPAPEADRRTLIRRLSFDLTGLPPTIAEVRAFLADQEPGAYERLVNRLLASPRYGERMAMEWLDAARYADTHGYHIDSHRDMWPWRDWLIEAINDNLPYDQFVVQQLAGDLLPGATLKQKVATGFSRNHVINFEGGAIPEEYRVQYVADRVETTSTLFLGLTIGCARCHDHKFDPISQREYYRFFAFFNTVPEKGLDGRKGNAVPRIKAPKPAQSAQMEEYAREISALEKSLQDRKQQADAGLAAWEQRQLDGKVELPEPPDDMLMHLPLDEGQGAEVTDAKDDDRRGKIHGTPRWAAGHHAGGLKFDGNTFVDLGDTANFDRDQEFSYGAWVFAKAGDEMAVIARLDDTETRRGYDLVLDQGVVAAHLSYRWPDSAIRVETKQRLARRRWHHVMVTYDGSNKAAGLRIYVDGKRQQTEATHDALKGTIKTTKPLYLGRRNSHAPFRGRLDDVRIYQRELSAVEVALIARVNPVEQILAVAPQSRSDEQQTALADYYVEYHDAEYRPLWATVRKLRKARTALDLAIPTTMVMQEMDKPRETFMLDRGQYNQPGEKVTAGVPSSLPPLADGAPPNRLGLAKWLVDPAHPLAARVTVNRYWQMVFGTGIVKTAEDFGSQGERPSHPKLLDWLATEFVRSGWDVAHMQRLIVTSAAYRQTSRVTPELLQRDPENRLLARGPRFRLSAEMIRDNALAIGGLLGDKIGGPSVKPYQPAGLWEEVAYGGPVYSAQTYEQDHGRALYRRSMYTFWKRSCPPPSLQTFDAPEREFCTVRRSRTNTPLQALVLMNDPTYVEASRVFAERIMTEGGSDPVSRIELAVEMAIARPPTPQETEILLGVLERHIADYRRDKQAALALLSVGERKRNEQLDVSELAAWTTIASMIFNLDESITPG